MGDFTCGFMVGILLTIFLLALGDFLSNRIVFNYEEDKEENNVEENEENENNKTDL